MAAGFKPDKPRACDLSGHVFGGGICAVTIIARADDQGRGPHAGQIDRGHGLARSRVGTQTGGARRHGQDAVQHGVDPRMLGRAGLGQKAGRGGQHGGNDPVSGDVHGGPEQEIRPDDPHHRSLDPRGHRFGRVGLAGRFIAQGHQQDQR